MLRGDVYRFRLPVAPGTSSTATAMALLSKPTSSSRGQPWSLPPRQGAPGARRSALKPRSVEDYAGTGGASRGHRRPSLRGADRAPNARRRCGEPTKRSSPSWAYADQLTGTRAHVNGAGRPGRSAEPVLLGHLVHDPALAGLGLLGCHAAWAYSGSIGARLPEPRGQVLVTGLRLY